MEKSESDIISRINNEIKLSPSAAGGYVFNENSKIIWSKDSEAGAPVIFDASTITGLDGVIAEYEWLIDDSSTYTGESISVELLNGDHVIQLSVYGYDNGRQTFNYYVSVAPESLGQNYYIDFDGGNDDDDGISKETPWKHSPGDVNARGGPGSIKLQAGDVVIFKGGVHYKGEVKLSGGVGEEDAPIIFDGNTEGDFGEGKAIFDGSDVLEGWAKCSSNESPVSEAIYCTSLPSGATELKANLYQEQEMLTLAQGPNVIDNYKFDDIATYREVPPVNATKESIVDAEFFTQEFESSWNGAYVYIWAYGNRVFKTPVTGFIPSENKILFEPISSPVYTDRNTKYAVTNHLSILDQVGEYVIDGSEVYLYPYNGVNPNMTEITVSVRKFGIDIRTSNNIIVQGFVFEKYTGGLKEYNDGVGVRVIGYTSANTRPKNITIRNNEIRFLRSMAKRGAISVQGSDFVKLSNNYIHHNVKNRGMIVSSSTNVHIENNVIYKGGDTGMAIFKVENVKVVGNTLLKQSGPHSNGVSVYMGSKDVVLYRNKILETNQAITTNKSSNILISHNMLHTENADASTVADWGNSTGLKYLNNVIQHPKSKALSVSTSSREGLIVKNNIIDGQLLGEMGPHISYNLYTKLAWKQNSKYGWSLGEGEMLEKDKSLVFVDYTNNDYRPAKGSIVLNAGAELLLGYEKDFSGNKVTSPFIGADGETLVSTPNTSTGSKGLRINFNISGGM